MTLENKSKELKELVSTYDTRWFLGDLSGLLKSVPSGGGEDQLGKLSSPMRQLYFLAGLLMSSQETDTSDNVADMEKWGKIVELLNEIEFEYYKLFFPKEEEEIDEEWKHSRKVAMPSFLAYFNQGPLNYEEQILNWVSDLYTQLDLIVEAETGLKTKHFIAFYENIDRLVQENFKGFGPNGNLRKDWKKFKVVETVLAPDLPDFMQEIFDEKESLLAFMTDHGIINRFFPEDIVSENLTLEQIKIILPLLSSPRSEQDFLYYTSTKPGNPIYDKPIINVGNGMFQVFEVKQIIHSIANLLEVACSKITANSTKLTDRKGKLLEDNIIELFKRFFKEDFEFFSGYYVDGNEQDILFIWKKYAFIIEAKGYNIREPLRDPSRAFKRIKDDFKSSLGYGYTQTKRVEQIFLDKKPLIIQDKHGKIIKQIDTTKFTDFSIIVNLNSFGQIQCDLSTLLEIDEDYIFPWAIKFDDLEVFLLTLIQQKKPPLFLINFLLMREELHGRLICSDELEICGAYLNGQINEQTLKKEDLIFTTPDLANIFDKQYEKKMGFRNEKYLFEKSSGQYMFF